MARELSPSDSDLSNAQSLLVVKPSSLGDIIHTLPVVSAIRRAHPHLSIRWVANAEWTPILEGHPDIDEVIPFPRRELRGAGAVLRFLKWTRALRQSGAPDIAIDFQGLFRSAVIARRSGARLVAGLSDAREGAGFLHHRTVPVGDAVHAVDRYLAVLGALGIEMPDEPGFPLPPGDASAIDLPDTFVLLHPFSRGEGKSLTPGHVRRFCEEMAPVPVVVVGKCAGDALMDLPEPAVSFLNRTSLTQLVGLMERARFIVSVDSGPMHMAAAVTSEVLSIHTWSDPLKVGPYRRDAWVWKGGITTAVGDLRDAGERTDEKPLDDASVVGIARWVNARLDKAERTP